ncbi:hypothetical protein Gogos_012012 [Gossypium gossypioides]|uniref:Leucine-rich repeat-containing N-terminal plant-type domain-containing protein n=1 Tax=Gossypium gossypioides TaxID=34282 RepID=A0A7J9BR94_GOSGO|nr:hypothetical protein [Gossypium gossypioides]
MATWRTSTQTLVLLCFLVLTKVNFLEAAESNTRSQNVACIERERNALLEFRKGLKDPSGWLSSWVGKDCCNWTGVNCSNTTGNVVVLHLKTMDYCGSVGHSEAFNRGTCLSGTLSPSLLNLTYLSYLDLSGNNFQGIPIPEFIGSLKTLRYLDLSRAAFIGEVPRSLGNLSYLEYLAANNWVEAVNMLPSLTTLDFLLCELQDFAESLTINFTSLSVLDLSYNNFNTTIPFWLFNITTLQRVNLQRSEIKGSLPEVSRGSLCNLRTLDLSLNAINGKIKGFIDALGGCGNNTLDYLDLSSNNLQGKLPDFLGNLKYLSVLRLAQNSFSGSLPWSIGNLSNLVMLDLPFNFMNGAIVESIGQLTRIATLNLYGNSWEGTITENHFRNLSRLSIFALSSIGKSVVFNLNPDWVPSFSLYEIAISNCQLGPRFPTWLRTQVDAFEIILSGAGISDIIPVWFWNLTSRLWVGGSFG